MLSQGEATIYLPSDEFMEIIYRLVPKGATVMFGTVMINEEGELEIEVAWDCCGSHPSEWAKPPRFMEEK